MGRGQTHTVAVGCLAGCHRAGRGQSVRPNRRGYRGGRRSSRLVGKVVAPQGQVFYVRPILGIAGSGYEGRGSYIGGEVSVVSGSASRSKEFGGSPETFVGHVSIPVGACGNPRRVSRKGNGWIQLNPTPGCDRGLGTGSGKRGIIRLIEPGGDCHHRGEVRGRGGGFIRRCSLANDIPWSRRVQFRHLKNIESGGGDLMPHSPVHILHGPHPFQVPTGLV